MKLVSPPVAYAVVLFFLIAWGGLALLRRQKSVAKRAPAFLLFCVVSVVATMWAAKRWELLVGSAAFAWVVALILLALVWTLRRVLQRES
jgi:hypothetical protein